jgi:hypothetical protein
MWFTVMKLNIHISTNTEHTIQMNETDELVSQLPLMLQGPHDFEPLGIQ